ncbi:MAG: response regulator, partial [Elusimicrobiota bacterium]
LLRDSLAGTEFDFKGALCGEEGLALARQLKPAVVTLDILMPRRDGWSVLRELKADPALAAIPVFILSILDNRELGFSLGVSDCLVKPFDKPALLSKLRSQARLAGGRVLVADSDPETVGLLSRGLQGEGLTVVAVGTGAAALSEWRQERPDALFLGTGLPDMSVLELAEEIGRDASGARVPVVILADREAQAGSLPSLEEAAVVRRGAIRVDEVLAGLRARFAAMGKEGQS